MKRLMLAALAFGLLSTTANAVVLYDPHNRVVPVTGHWVNHGNRTTHFNQYGAFIGTSIRRGNVSTLYNPNGKFAGIVRRDSNGATQSWDARGRPLFHSYGRY